MDYELFWAVYSVQIMDKYKTTPNPEAMQGMKSLDVLVTVLVAAAGLSRGAVHPSGVRPAAALAPAGSAGGGSKAAASDRATPVPVARVDLERYAGTWYELAKIPNRFQKDCAGGTTATYTLREDGRIDVVNRCRRPDGSFEEARGVAKVVDNATHARLKVSFVSILGIRPFWGDYWILGLGPGYEYAVVGSPDRKYGWVLARSPDPGPEVLERAFDILRRQGYDPAGFEITPQDAP